MRKDGFERRVVGRGDRAARSLRIRHATLHLAQPANCTAGAAVVFFRGNFRRGCVRSEAAKIAAVSSRVAGQHAYPSGPGGCDGFQNGQRPRSVERRPLLTSPLLSAPAVSC